MAIHDKLVKNLYELLTARSLPSEPPKELTEVDGYSQLYETLLEVRTGFMAIASGDLDFKIMKKGYMAGSIKTLQASLSHLTWQAKAIASGDFAQRVDFLGEFSDAFNVMAEELEKSRNELKNKSEAEFLSLAESMPHIVWISRPDGWNTYFNQQWVEYTGLTLEESSGYTWSKTFHPNDLQQAWDAWQNALTAGTTYAHECRLRRSDGVYRWWLIRGVPVKDEHSTITKWFGTCTDIDVFKNTQVERILFEQQLQHTQRLESLGVLSGGIAHDFNNILAVIIGRCSLAEMDHEKAGKHIPEIEKAANQAAGLCRQMLAYAGKAQLNKTRVSMLELVDEIVTMLKSTLPQNAVVKPDLSADILPINADASQLRQVVMNLIINASEAIGEEQGEIRVSLARTNVVTGASHEDFQGKEIIPGEYICLEVTDTGCGMDEATKFRIFEPFYTTKFTGRGLGMSAVLGIIKSHGGAMQLFSQLGQGTTFKVYLPVPAGISAGDGKNMHIPSIPWQGSGTILLAEDNDQIREIAKTLLEMFGFTVLEAVNGKEALELYQKNAADITMVLTDMGMPVMDGYALFPVLKQHNPNLPIIISSGFGDIDVFSRIDRNEVAGVISKPYTPDKLREVLKCVLEGTQSPNIHV